MLRSIQPFHFGKSHFTGQVSGAGSLVASGWLSGATDGQSVIHCEPVGADYGALLFFSLTLGKEKGVCGWGERKGPQGEGACSDRFSSFLSDMGCLSVSSALQKCDDP